MYRGDGRPSRPGGAQSVGAKVDVTFRARGLGTFLLKRVLLESFQVAQHAGGIAVLVDALDQRRVEWYEKNADFRALREGGTRLMLSMKTLAKALG